MNIEEFMWIVWLGLFVLALIVEAIGAEIVSIWFAGGALVALILSFIPNIPWWVELIVFTCISVALLACLRPLIKRFFSRDEVRSNIDSIVHKKGKLLEGIDPLHTGIVEIGDVKWTAIAQGDDDIIEEGAVVEVLAVSGNKLIVRPYLEKERKE